jgi:hypothetical protein
MGARIISGGDITIASASLDDLADVIITETGANSFLVKDNTGNWISKSLEDVVSLITSNIEISSLEGDNKSIIVEDNKISLFDFDNAEAGSSPTKDENGNLSWIKPDTYSKSEIENLISNSESSILTTVNDKLDEKADKASTLAGYGIEDAYTKNDVYTRS